MTIFHLEITEHAGQFGENSMAERAVLIGLLSQAAQAIGSGHAFGTADDPVPLTLAGEKVGKFWAGSGSHTLRGK